VPTYDEALERLMTLVVIDMADLAVLTGVHVSTAQRRAVRGDLPVPFMRIGQRWIIPSKPVREALHLDDGAA
jgi:predicted site-specific integrase-resolvase